MTEISVSLLERVRDQADAVAWKLFDDLCRPLIHDWLRRRCSLQAQDADDLVQAVMAVVAREMPSFRYDSGRGSFRGWLRTLTSHRLLAFWKKRASQPRTPGDAEVARIAESLQ